PAGNSLLIPPGPTGCGRFSGRTPSDGDAIVQVWVEPDAGRRVWPARCRLISGAHPAKPVENSRVPFPNIDPVAFAIGPFAVRWYALAYLFGVLLGAGYGYLLLRNE